MQKILFNQISGGLCLLSLHYHRLNGSSSPVLTATSRSYGIAENSTLPPIESKLSGFPIGIKFGTVDYVSEMTPGAKFYANPSIGGFSANGWSIRQNFYLYIPFFHKLTYRSDPSADFRTRWCKKGLTLKCAFWGLKNLKLKFYLWKIPPKSKIGPKTRKKFGSKRTCTKFSSINCP